MSLWESDSDVALADTVCERFSSPDSDITIRSTDGILFKVHRKNLETYSEAFPGEDIGTLNEIVQLSEDSETLELLFQFMCRQPFPVLDNVPFKLSAKLAEAGEKYRVSSVMAICRYVMKQNISKHPLEVLGYASRHGHADMSRAAAPLTIDISAKSALETLGAAVFIQWALYRDEWSSLLPKVLANPPVIQLHKGAMVSCELWFPFRERVMSSLTQLSALQTIAAIIEGESKESLDTCVQCRNRAKYWRDRCVVETEKIPPFGMTDNLKL